MFLNSVFSSIALRAVDPEQERDAPDRPTPVEFPVYTHFSPLQWTQTSPPPDLQLLFAELTRISGISLKHVVALNIAVEADCSPEALLPPTSDGISYFACGRSRGFDTIDSPASISPDGTALMSKLQEFDARAIELLVSNSTAFKIVTKSGKPEDSVPVKHGQWAVKVKHLWKFWVALEDMSQYWDSSLDQYFESKASDERHLSTKRQRLDRGDCNASLPVPSGVDVSQTENDDRDGAAIQAEESTSPELQKSAPKPIERYKGRRIGSGRQMPDQYLVAAVRAFVEAAVWPFKSTLAPPRHMPIVQIKNLNIPVRQTSAVYRFPKQPDKARQGYLEGPMLAVQVRSYHDLHGLNTPDSISRLDLMRELGGLLQIAQERRRQFKEEVKPGQGKWWTSKPRWGGMPIPTSTAPCSGDKTENGKSSDKADSPPTARNAPMPQVPRKKTLAMHWEEVKCGNGFWDPRTKYEAIGLDPTSDYDEVFMVSAIYHHVAILKLTIHMAYTEFLLTGELPDPLPSDEKWCSPRLQRSKWHDLFDGNDRVDLFEMLWAVMGHLTRDYSTDQ